MISKIKLKTSERILIISEMIFDYIFHYYSIERNIPSRQNLFINKLRFHEAIEHSILISFIFYQWQNTLVCFFLQSSHFVHVPVHRIEILLLDNRFFWFSCARVLGASFLFSGVSFILWFGKDSLITIWHSFRFLNLRRVADLMKLNSNTRFHHPHFLLLMNSFQLSIFLFDILAQVLNWKYILLSSF